MTASALSHSHTGPPLSPSLPCGHPAALSKLWTFWAPNEKAEHSPLRIARFLAGPTPGWVTRPAAISNPCVSEFGSHAFPVNQCYGHGVAHLPMGEWVPREFTRHNSPRHRCHRRRCYSDNAGNLVVGTVRCSPFWVAHVCAAHAPLPHTMPRIESGFVYLWFLSLVNDNLFIKKSGVFTVATLTALGPQ